MESEVVKWERGSGGQPALSSAAQRPEQVQAHVQALVAMFTPTPGPGPGSAALEAASHWFSSNQYYVDVKIGAWESSYLCVCVLSQMKNIASYTLGPFRPGRKP